MAVINGKHVVVLADVERYRDIGVMEDVARIAKLEGVNPDVMMARYKSGEKALCEIVNKNVDSWLNIMVESLNDLIKDAEKKA